MKHPKSFVKPAPPGAAVPQVSGPVAQPPSAGHAGSVAQPPSAGHAGSVAQPPSAGHAEYEVESAPPGAAVPQAAGHAGSEAPPGAAVPQVVYVAGFNEVAGLAKSGKSAYRRNLPHLQADGRMIFLTFCTYQRWVLPEAVRDMVLRHCLYDHGSKIELLGAVVMPDHVHLLFQPLCDSEGNYFTLAEITNGIKGASAHSVNRALGRKGSVWQDESFDHMLRSDESVEKMLDYICANPVRKGLCQRIEEYRWMWRPVAQPPSAGL